MSTETFYMGVAALFFFAALLFAVLSFRLDHRGYLIANGWYDLAGVVAFIGGVFCVLRSWGLA